MIGPGYDPYDALNSRLFGAFPFLNTRVLRIVLTQALKRSPVNLRPLLAVDKTQNPKSLALFLVALLKLRNLGLLDDESILQRLVAQITALRSPDVEYWSWGYSFPWQTRTILVPRGASNLVCTTFVANALLDAFEVLGDMKCLEHGGERGRLLGGKALLHGGRWSRFFQLSFANFESEGSQRELPRGCLSGPTVPPHRG